MYNLFSPCATFPYQERLPDSMIEGPSPGCTSGGCTQIPGDADGDHGDHSDHGDHKDVAYTAIPQPS